MPKALLWDFGNVIVRWDPRTLYSKIFPDPEALIRQSPAASPFLDLLKQRITGGKRPAESPTAENAKDGAKSN